MKLRKILSLAAAIAITSGFSLAHAAELAGHWTAEFDSQIGTQKYTYDFKTEGDKTTGKASFEHSMGKGETDLSAIKLSGDDVSFTETVNIQGNPITVTYTGKISGDEMKLTRQVGDFATEQIVAKRSTGTPAQKPAEKK